MKTKSKIFVIVMFFSMFLISCTSSIDRDAKKIATVNYEMQKWSIDLLYGIIDYKKAETIKKAEELDKLNEENKLIKKKYVTDEEKQKFDAAVEREILKLQPKLEAYTKELEAKFPDKNPLGGLEKAFEGAFEEMTETE